VAPTKEVNVYSSRHYDADDQIYQKFTEETGIKVNIVEGQAEELIERINTEGANSPADVLITVDAGNLWRAEQDGLFAPVESPTLQERIPANLRNPDNLWFGFTKRARVIMYNPDRVKVEELSTYEDLTDPKWKGRIAVRSSSNIYNQSLVASLVANLGEEKTEAWIKGLVANFARSPEGNDRDQIEAVASGAADIAIANTYYLPRYANPEDPAQQEIFDKVKVFFPNQSDRGAHVNISGGGMVKTAPHPEEAVKFLEFLTSDIAQEIFAGNNNEYPVVEGVPLAPVLQGFGSFKDDSTNVALYGEFNAKAVELMDRAGWK
jgi:iron(III) transport system substrate-binding protein